MYKTKIRLSHVVLFSTLWTNSGCDGTTWTLSPKWLEIVDKDDDRGDEPYLGIIQYQSTPGVVGSTAVHYLGGLHELGDNVDAGTRLDIPVGTWVSRYDNVELVSRAQLTEEGTMPAMLGAVVVAFESDLTPFSTVDEMMQRVANQLHTELVDLVEPLTIGDLADPASIGPRIGSAMNSVRAAAELCAEEEFLIFLESGGDPDESLGFRFVLFGAVEDDLRGLMENSSVCGALPAGNRCGALSEQLFTFRYSDPAATYDVNFEVQQHE